VSLDSIINVKTYSAVKSATRHAHTKKRLYKLLQAAVIKQYKLHVEEKWNLKHP